MPPTPPAAIVSQVIDGRGWNIIWPDGTWQVVVGFGVLTDGNLVPLVVDTDGMTISQASAVNPKFTLTRANMSG